MTTALATPPAPTRDLMDLGSDLREITTSLIFVSKGLDKAYLDTIEARDKHELAAMERHALDAAARTARRVMADLAVWVGSIEKEMA